MLPRRPAITPHRALGLPVEGTSLGQHWAPSNAFARYPRILHHPVWKTERALPRSRIKKDDRPHLCPVQGLSPESVGMVVRRVSEWAWLRNQQVCFLLC